MTDVGGDVECGDLEGVELWGADGPSTLRGRGKGAYALPHMNTDRV